MNHPPHHWSYIPCASSLRLPSRTDRQRSSTAAFCLSSFSEIQLPLIPRRKKRGFLTSTGLDSHNLTDIQPKGARLGCFWHRHGHTRGAEWAQVRVCALLTAGTRCGFSKHMTSVITSMGALNRFKFCTYVARQQHNRSQSPHHRRRRQPPPPPPNPLIRLSAGIAVLLSLKMVN